MPRPTLATNSSDAAEVAAWDEKNDKALGTILLYVALNLKHYVDKAYMALEAWNTLAAEYEKPGAVGAFVAFQKLFNAQLSDGLALGPQIDAVIEMANQVNNAGIEVKEQLVALLLVNCLPKFYQQIASTILTTHVNLTKLKPSNVCPRIIKEESRCVANRMQILRISKAPQLKKYCEKCGKDTNHTTEQHWEKGKRPNFNNNNGQSGSSGSSDDGN
jgi:hypothetical protein